MSTYIELSIRNSGRSVIPEPTARSAVPGVSPGRGLLIPHGYLHPEKKTALADSKVGVIVGWVVISLISKIWMFISSGRGKNYKKKHVRKLKNCFTYYFFEEMIRIDLIKRGNREVYLYMTSLVDAPLDFVV